jgi:hypothetical protein
MENISKPQVACTGSFQWISPLLNSSSARVKPITLSEGSPHRKMSQVVSNAPPPQFVYNHWTQPAPLLSLKIGEKPAKSEGQISRTARQDRPEKMGRLAFGMFVLFGFPLDFERVPRKGYASVSSFQFGARLWRLGLGVVVKLDHYCGRSTSQW